MAVIRDMIPPCELFQPANIDDALNLLDRYGENSWVLAGGLDSFDWFKDRVKRPEAIVDLGGIEELKGIRADGEGLIIGSMTTLTEVVTHPDIVARFGILAQAAAEVATPQIRNQGTIGGNLAQDTRCWYYRGGWPCYRAGGNICYASAPKAMNAEHCVFGASRCVAVNPSDTAPAMIALDATMVVAGSSGEREYDAEDFFIGPGVDITRMTVMEPGDLLTEIRIPGTWAGADFYFEKIRDRKSWDFSLVTVASAILTSGGTIRDARISVNGVAPFPMRLPDAEQAVVGQAPTDEIGTAAGDIAVRRARPLRHNAYKLPLMRNLVRRAVRAEV